MVCSVCGAQNTEDARYCAECGIALLPQGEPDDTAALTIEETPDTISPVLPQAGEGGSRQAYALAELVVLEDGNEVDRVAVVDGQRLVVGRAAEADLHLDDSSVSRRHAELRAEATAIIIDDVGSLNGTFVNGRRVDSQVLSNGDEIVVGRYRLRLVLAG